MILGSWASEKHVACRGGGANYCTLSLDVVSAKDNYASVVGGAV